MERVTFQDPRVARKVNAGYVPVRLEVGENLAFFNTFGEAGIPLVVLLEPGGSVVKKLLGYLPPDAFLTALP
jgi:thiol:disulfide interchange protein